MKQVKMNLSEKSETYFKSQDDCKKKQRLSKVCKALFILGGGIGCFLLDSNYPDVEKAMFESLKDYSLKNGI